MKKLVALLMTLALCISCIAGYAEVDYQPGTYQAEARGRNGMLGVAVTFDESSVTNIEVLHSIETANIGDIAVKTTVEYILTNQSLSMDAVTGATMTQNAVINAVKDCVKQAGGDAQALMVAPQAAQVGEAIELTPDVVVVGGGLSGMMSAIVAAENGADVILLERQAYIGGNSMLSSGAFHMGATDLQKEAGIEDSVESFASDLVTKAQAQGGSRRVDAMKMFAEGSNDALNWLMERGIEFSSSITSGMGDSKPRFTRIVNGMPALFNTLADVAQKAGVKTMLETLATEIVVDAQGEATGVRAIDKTGQEYLISAKNTVLAVGGYRASEELTVKYTGYENLIYCGLPGVKGELIDQAIDLGAATEYLDCPYLSPTYNKASLTAITSIMLSKGGILLNNAGERFCDETQSYRDVALNILGLGQEGNQVVEVLNGSVKALEPAFVEKYTSLGIVTEYATLAELAAGLGVDEAVLTKTYDTYNAAVRGEIEDPFGRVIFADEAVAPYYVIKVGPGGNISGGGLLTNEKCKVVKEDGSTFDHLYAIGNTAGGGGIFAWGYAGGDALGYCAVTGMIAGEDVSAVVN